MSGGWGSGGSSTPSAPANAQFLTLATDATLTDERVFTIGNGLDATDGGAGGSYTVVVDETELNHNILANLTTGDVHTQYALLAGRSGGQSLIGGTAASNTLTLTSTSHATAGNMVFNRKTGSEFMRISAGSLGDSLMVGQTTESAAGGTVDILGATLFPAMTVYNSADGGTAAYFRNSNASGTNSVFTAVHDNTGNTAVQPIIKLARQTGTVGRAWGIQFDALDSLGAGPNYAKIYATIINNVSGGGAAGEGALTMLVAMDAAPGDAVNCLETTGHILVINEGGNDFDFRVESDGDANNLFSDGGNNTVIVGGTSAADSSKFYVVGKISTSDEMEINGALNHDGTTVGLYAAVPVVQGTGGQNVTNNVTDTASTAGTIPDITDGVVYANDYVNLRNALFQISRMLKQDHDQLRAMGILT